ncbi:10277_t:CDS:2 [Rhizophagus irregularis]|nr:10277_t:CDS:2 [Rhizophagus irregularis]
MQINNNGVMRKSDYPDCKLRDFRTIGGKICWGAYKIQKPVNDLIKFWAEKQDKDKELEQTPRSPRRPLSPTSSLPPSPLNENFYSKSLFKDIPSNTPPLTPLYTPNNIHSLISEEVDNINGRSEKLDLSSQNVSQSDSPEDGTSINITNNNKLVINTDLNTKDYFSRKPRDYDLNNIRDNKISRPLPPVRKVTDLVSKFEKVASPTNSVQTSPRLTPIKRGQSFAQSSPSSPRIQLTPEPLSLNLPNPSTLSTKAKRRQTVPEPLNFSPKKFTDDDDGNLNKDCESTPASPISPIENLSNNIPIAQPTSTLNTTVSIPEKTTSVKLNAPEKQQESLSLKNNDDKQIKKNVSIDCLDFLTETFKDTSFDLSNQSGSTNDLKYSSERGFILPEVTPIRKPTTESTKVSAPPFLKSISEKIIHTRHSNPISRSKTFPRLSHNTNNETSKNSNLHEIADLLPQPEPVSPIRLNFSDFSDSPNGSSTNLNSISPLDDKVNFEKSKKDGEKEKQINNNTLIYKVVVESKSEASKKNENPKPIRHLSGSIQLFENLKRYLNNKQKNSDDINPSTKKLSQNFNNDNQLNQLY